MKGKGWIYSPTLSKRVHNVYIPLIIFLYLLLIPSIGYSEKGEWVPGAIHLHTVIGDGDGVFSPLEMVESAKEKGLGVAIINDHDNERVEYGLFPLRKIIRKVEERKSISEYGVSNYLNAIEKTDRSFPEVIVMSGPEAVPAYYWEGNLIDKNLTLNNWHKHILIMGLSSAEEIEGIPSVGKGWPVEIGAGCILRLWPVVLLPLGIFLIQYKSERTFKFSNIKFKERKQAYKVYGYAVVIVGIVFLINNYPYCTPSYDPYHGDPGIGPYQEVIDYVNDRGGVTFWAHPDVAFDKTVSGVKVHTPSHSEDLIKSRNYTGFAALIEGQRISQPGGIWDRLLQEYLQGLREKPVWAVGELDYVYGDWMGETQTVFYLKERSKEDVLNALKGGSMYAVTGVHFKPAIKRFEVFDEMDNSWKTMGGTARVNEKVKINIEIEYPADNELELRLIKDGKVIKSWPFKGYLNETWEETVTDKTYYRIDIDSLLIGNPVFVKRLKK